MGGGGHVFKQYINCILHNGSFLSKFKVHISFILEISLLWIYFIEILKLWADYIYVCVYTSHAHTETQKCLVKIGKDLNAHQKSS